MQVFRFSRELYLPVVFKLTPNNGMGKELREVLRESYF